MMLGKRIAQYRKEQGLTQEVLAQELGVTNQAVSKWELDQSCPDIQLLPQLADIFGITVDELFGREAKKQESVSADVDWPEDGVLRVVVYEGRKLICGGEAAEDFKLKYEADVKEILSAVNITCGDVKGDVWANLSVNCTEVGGDVDAGTSVNCGNIDGSVDAGTNVNCGNIGGDVDAGTSVNCGNIGGNVDAGASVTCGNVEGDVDAGGNVRCQSIAGDVDAGGKVQIG